MSIPLSTMSSLTRSLRDWYSEAGALPLEKAPGWSERWGCIRVFCEENIGAMKSTG